MRRMKCIVLVSVFVLAVAITVVGRATTRLNRESRNESGIGSKISGWSFGPHERRISLGAFQHFGQVQRVLSTCAKSKLRGISAG